MCKIYRNMYRVTELFTGQKVSSPHPYFQIEKETLPPPEFEMHRKSLYRPTPSFSVPCVPTHSQATL